MRTSNTKCEAEVEGKLARKGKALHLSLFPFQHADAIPATAAGLHAWRVAVMRLAPNENAVLPPPYHYH